MPVDEPLGVFSQITSASKARSSTSPLDVLSRGGDGQGGVAESALELPNGDPVILRLILHYLCRYLQFPRDFFDAG
jgi:hypothetical protein